MLCVTFFLVVFPIVGGFGGCSARKETFVFRLVSDERLLVRAIRSRVDHFGRQGRAWVVEKRRDERADVVQRIYVYSYSSDLLSSRHPR
jgi:TfoX/Sxy family transcriptional regulator of competence genes